MNILLALTLLLGADAYDKVFEQGLAHLDGGQYPAAAQSFEQLVDEGVVAPELFYNLGLAYHQAGQRGLALANYERALRLNPDLVVAQDNHYVLLSELERNQAAPMAPAWQQALLFWDNGLGYSTVRWLAILAWAGFWLLLGVRFWRPVRYAGVVGGMVLAIALLCGLSAWAKTHPMPLAVVLQDNTPAYYGIQDLGAVRFELFEGDRVKVDENREGWMRIETAGGVRGWVQQNNLVELGPPYKIWRQQEVDARVTPQTNEIVAATVRQD